MAEELREMIVDLFPPKMFLAHRDNIADAVMTVIGPVLEGLSAPHYAPYADEEHQGGYCYDLFVKLAAATFKAKQERNLLLWLHAEAVWEREQADFEAARQERGWRNVIDAWERHMTNAVLPYTTELETEISRLRREVDFEANGLETGAEYLGFDEPRRTCACVSEEQAEIIRAGGFSRPVCTVHPEGE